MRVHRLISILLLIESKGIIKAREIASTLEISRRTVYRDIDTLCEAGIPLATIPGPNGGIYLMEGYSAGIGYLQEEDIIHLYINSLGIIPDKHSDLAMKLNDTLMKLQKNLSSNQIAEVNKVKSRFYFDDTFWWEENPSKNGIDLMLSAVLGSQALEFTYTKYNGETSIRKVKPYGIVVKRRDWYLVAYCEKNKAIRTFQCGRIMGINILEELFETPSDFSLERYWHTANAAFKNLCTEELYPVLIKLKKCNSDCLTNLEVLEIKVDNDDILATINMYGYEFAIDDIMKIIRYAEVIQPIELRTFIESDLQKILLNYTSS